MHIGAVLVLTGAIPQEEFAIFCSAKRGPDQSAISHELIWRKYCNGCLMWLTVGNIGRMADTRVRHVTFFVDCDCCYLSILREIFEPSKDIFAGNLWWESDHIDNILLHYADWSEPLEIKYSWLRNLLDILSIHALTSIIRRYRIFPAESECVSSSAAIHITTTTPSR